MAVTICFLVFGPEKYIDLGGDMATPPVRGATPEERTMYFKESACADFVKNFTLLPESKIGILGEAPQEKIIAGGSEGNTLVVFPQKNGRSIYSVQLNAYSVNPSMCRIAEQLVRQTNLSPQ
ncbi:MAG: hypothetical protein QM526_02560 [Alphaproteobacteria bacterium]|nr:hypothetical protein [Alphaproteobacteria bacterium]